MTALVLSQRDVQALKIQGEGLADLSCGMRGIAVETVLSVTLSTRIDPLWRVSCKDGHRMIGPVWLILKEGQDPDNNVNAQEVLPLELTYGRRVAPRD